MTFSVYDIWRNLNFLLFGVDLICLLIEIHLLSLYKCAFTDVFDLAERCNRQRRYKEYTVKCNTFTVNELVHE